MQRARRSDVRLDRLRLLAIVAPLAYIISLVAILEFASLGFWAESALALGISLPLIALFALGVFRIFGGMQDELIRNEDRFRNLLESAPDAIVIVDQHGRIVIVNQQAERVFGYRRDELVGASVETLVPEHLRGQHPQHRHDFAADAQRRPMGAGLALLARRKDGSLFPAEISLSPIASDEGMLVSSVIRDISDRRRAEEERERLMAEAETERERQRIGMDLHDGVIQSIYAVGLNLEAAADDVETAPKDVQARIDKAIEQLSDTIRDIRSYIFDLAPARARAGDFAQSLQNLVTEFRVNSLIDARATIGSHLPELGEEREVALFHIAQEALNNVRKHTRASTVTVDVRGEDASVVLTVVDDGAGFDMTAEVSDAHHGLRNMQARAYALGGDVSVESAPGGGTTVRARVPVGTVISA